MTLAFRNDDVPALLADFGVAVIFNGVTFKGIPDVKSIVAVDDRGRGTIVGTERALTIRKSDAPAINMDSQLTVDGVVYYVRDFVDEGDSALVKLLLSATRGT